MQKSVEARAPAASAGAGRTTAQRIPPAGKPWTGGILWEAAVRVLPVPPGYMADCAAHTASIRWEYKFLYLEHKNNQPIHHAGRDAEHQHRPGYGEQLGSQARDEALAFELHRR